MIREISALALAALAGAIAPAARADSSPAAAPVDASPSALVEAAAAANREERWAAAESLATRAIERAAAAPDAAPRDAVAARLALGSALVARRLVADGRALDAAESALDVAGALGGEGDSLRAESHLLLSRVLVEVNEPEAALDHARSAVDLFRLYPAAREPLALALRSAAVGFEKIGEADSARASYREALEIRERLDPPRDRAIGLLHVDLARLEQSVGNPDEARSELDRAIREIERRAAPDDPAVIQAYQRAASLEYEAGDFSRSVDFSRRALALARSAGGVDPIRVAVVQSTLASTLAEMGDFDGAYRFLDEAIPVIEATYGPAHPRSTRNRYIFANALAGLGDSTRAVAELRRVRETIGNDSSHAHAGVLAETLCFEAELIGMKDPRRAIALAQRAEAVEASAPMRRPELPVLARALSITAAARLKDRESVDRLAESLRGAIDSCRCRGSVVEAHALERWADAEARAGRGGESFRIALESSRISREVLQRNVRTLPDREGLRFSSARSPALSSFLGCVVAASPDSAAAAWSEVIRWRGLVAAEVAARRPPEGGGADSEAARAHAAWVRTRGRLAQAETRAASEAGPEDVDPLAELRAEADAAEREWARLAPRGGGPGEIDPPDLAAIRRSLAGNEALVGFALAWPADDPERVLAFVARGGEGGESNRENGGDGGDGRDGGGEPIRFLDLGPSDAIANAAREWRRLAARSPRDAPGVEAECRAAGRRLRALTWDAIEPALGGVEHVYLVPDGPIHEVAWSALPDDDGAYLVETGPTLHELAAERDLLNRGAPPAGEMLAIGGIDFDRARELHEILSTTSAPPEREGVAGDPLPLLAMASPLRSGDCAAASSLRFASLPETAGGVRSIALDGAAARILTGADATEAAFKRLAPGNAVVHLATHGFVLADSCASAPGTRGVGGVAPVGGGAPAGSASGKAPRDASPWLGRRTLLALAGANRAAEHVEDENEGFLTAEEVATLDLRGTDWVVLSACRSGVAESWTGEGLLGMRRAFRIAGARTVIASAWDVADDATREWMGELYEARGRGAGAADAVRAASRSVLAARRSSGRSTHPFYWAAFTATGD